MRRACGAADYAAYLWFSFSNHPSKKNRALWPHLACGAADFAAIRFSACFVFSSGCVDRSVGFDGFMPLVHRRGIVFIFQSGQFSSHLRTKCTLQPLFSTFQPLFCIEKHLVFQCRTSDGGRQRVFMSVRN